jgi:hypothetical protein
MNGREFNFVKCLYKTNLWTGKLLQGTSYVDTISENNIYEMFRVLSA